jgi:hypothetical protein
MTSPTEPGKPRAPLAALVAAVIALGVTGGIGCGSDNEGPVEEAGKAVDQGAKDVSSAADDVDVNVTTNADKHEGGQRKKK